MDLEKVTGVWVQAGEHVPPENAKARLIYKGRAFEGRLGDKVLFKGSVKLDPTQNPKALDLTVESGPGQVRTMLGVYELDGENYRGCLAAPGKPRPASMTPAPKSGQQAFAFRRWKEPGPAVTAVQAELKRFEGRWSYASAIVDGKPAPEAILKAGRLDLAGEKFTLIASDATHKGTFAVDPAAAPKTIDVTFSEGPRAGQTCKGIYELNGDTCKVCIALAGQPRPTEFASPAGRGLALEVLERVKP
jgi:uncharacterized protein (TIGR03067 family)